MNKRKEIQLRKKKSKIEKLGFHFDNSNRLTNPPPLNRTEEQSLKLSFNTSKQRHLSHGSLSRETASN